MEMGIRGYKGILTARELHNIAEMLAREPIEAFARVVELAFSVPDKHAHEFIISAVHTVEGLKKSAMDFCRACGLCCPDDCIVRIEKEEENREVYRCGIHDNSALGLPIPLEDLTDFPKTLGENERAMYKEMVLLSRAKPYPCDGFTPVNSLFSHIRTGNSPLSLQRDCVQSLLSEAKNLRVALPENGARARLRCPR